MIYNFYNKYHLGDNIFNIIFFNIINDYLTEHKIIINYYCLNQYIYQINEFNTCKNVTIKDIIYVPQIASELWINNEKIGYTLIQKYDELNQNSINVKKRIDYNDYYVNFFNSLLEKLKFNIKIGKIYYKDKDLFKRYKTINDKHNNKYHKLDILIANSQPFSDQYNYNKSEWDYHIRFLSKKYKLVTTTKVEGIPCTLDDQLTVKDIASISLKAKVIIAVNSGVVPGFLNKYTINNVKKIYIFDDRCKFSYKNFENKSLIREITYEELEKYI